MHSFIPPSYNKIDFKKDIKTKCIDDYSLMAIRSLTFHLLDIEGQALQNYLCTFEWDKTIENKQKWRHVQFIQGEIQKTPLQKCDTKRETPIKKFINA